MSSIIAQGNSYYIAGTTSAAHTTIVAPVTNTFQFTNTDSANVAFVGVFNSNLGATFGHPGTNSPNVGIAVTPRSSLIVTGNFAAQNTANVTISVITASGTTPVYVTPVTPLA